MRRPPINVFSLSFLDLFSCALAGVIVLMLIFVKIIEGQRLDRRVFLFSSRVTVSVKTPDNLSKTQEEMAALVLAARVVNPSESLSLALVDPRGVETILEQTPSGAPGQAQVGFAIRRPAHGQWRLYLRPSEQLLQNLATQQPARNASFANTQLMSLFNDYERLAMRPPELIDQQALVQDLESALADIGRGGFALDRALVILRAIDWYNTPLIDKALDLLTLPAHHRSAIEPLGVLRLTDAPSWPTRSYLRFDADAWAALRNEAFSPRERVMATSALLHVESLLPSADRRGKSWLLALAARHFIHFAPPPVIDKPAGPDSLNRFVTECYAANYLRPQNLSAQGRKLVLLASGHRMVVSNPNLPQAPGVIVWLAEGSSKGKYNLNCEPSNLADFSLMVADALAKEPSRPAPHPFSDDALEKIVALALDRDIVVRPLQEAMDNLSRFPTLTVLSNVVPPELPLHLCQNVPDARKRFEKLFELTQGSLFKENLAPVLFYIAHLRGQGASEELEKAMQAGIKLQTVKAAAATAAGAPGAPPPPPPLSLTAAANELPLLYFDAVRTVIRQERFTVEFDQGVIHWGSQLTRVGAVKVSEATIHIDQLLEIILEPDQAQIGQRSKTP